MAKNNKQTAGQDGVSKMVALGSKKFIAQHLNYARTSAVMRLQKVSLPATYPIFSNNLSYISQGLMSYFSGTSPVYSNVFTYIVALPQAFLSVYHR